MSDINVEVVLLLENNSKDSYCNGIEILLRLLNNIIKEPDNLKYRKFKTNNKTILQKLLPLEGIKELLLSIGFLLEDNEYILPSNVLIKRIKKYKELIEKRLTIISERNISENKPCTSKIEAISFQESKNPVVKVDSPKILSSKSYLQRISYPNILLTENQFLKKIENNSDQVTQYEDEKLLEIGKKLIPVERLTTNANRNLHEIQKAINLGKFNEPEPCLRDLLLVELANWFHDDFFEWVNNVKCVICGNVIRNCKNSVEEGIRVELGWCCNFESRFFRYNDIAQLLRTRRGRCGEYANCFTFFCRCLDYDARHVVATFDHVWTEVYSETQQRWIHIDPSDNVIDAPLMYQHGWNRKVDYVIGYSRDDIQDVTWRYTSNHKETLKIRNLCMEDELLKAIMQLRKKRQTNLSDTRIKYLNTRYLNELIELTKQRTPTDSEKKGRSSGSLSWRAERGEQHLNNFYIFEALPEEIEGKNFNLRFSCVKNIYERFTYTNNNEKLLKLYSDFSSTTFVVKNIFRKIEKDWKMTYLARNEECLTGEIIWKFDFRKTNLKILSYKLKFETKTFENGNINLEITDLSGSKKISQSNGMIIKVFLGGEKDVVWQHAQLFRQNLNSDDYPFVLNIEFE